MWKFCKYSKKKPKCTKRNRPQLSSSCLFLYANFFNRALWGVANGKIRDSPRRRDPSQKSEPLFGKKFRDSKKVKTNHAKTRLRDWSKMLSRFRDPIKIFRDPRFSRYHSPPLLWGDSLVFHRATRLLSWNKAAVHPRTFTKIRSMVGKSYWLFFFWPRCYEEVCNVSRTLVVENLQWDDIKRDHLGTFSQSLKPLL